MRKLIIISIFILISFASKAQNYYRWTAIDSSTFVVFADSLTKQRVTIAKNFMTIAMGTTTRGYAINITVTGPHGEYIFWDTSTVKYLAPTIAEGMAKLNSMAYAPTSSTNTTIVIDSGGVANFLVDSNTVFELQQDTIGAGETKSYNPYSFGMAFEGASGSTDVTLGGSTMTYNVSMGNLPYNPSHRQPVTIDNTGLTSGRIRILFK